MPEQEVFMNHAEGGKEAYGSQRALETGCNTGALKSVRTPRESPQKMSSICATAAAGCERHQFTPKLKSLSSFYLPWVSFKVEDSHIYNTGRICRCKTVRRFNEIIIVNGAAAFFFDLASQTQITQVRCRLFILPHIFPFMYLDSNL